MSAATSPGTGLAYGLRRVCAAWGMARSGVLRHDLRPAVDCRAAAGKASGTEARDLGPVHCMVAIEADLETSPWEGEGYRKVWARLRVMSRHPRLPASGCSA